MIIPTSTRNKSMNFEILNRTIEKPIFPTWRMRGTVRDADKTKTQSTCSLNVINTHTLYGNIWKESYRPSIDHKSPEIKADWAICQKSLDTKSCFSKSSTV